MANSFDRVFMGAAGGAVDLPSDDEFDNVSFLSHFDGSNNGTNIVYDDGSASDHTVSITGTPTQGTSGPFARVDGEWSNLFDSEVGNYDYLEIASTSDFNFGTGDFTWEFWFFGTPSGSYAIFYSQAGAEFGVYFEVSSGKLYYDNAAISDTEIGTLPLNSWNHIAVSRVSGTSNLYLNGTRTATVSDAQDYATGTARVGNYLSGDGSTYPMKGYISNVRIIKGTGLYSASSITVPTSALTAISGTVLLTCQSNRFIDNSASAHTLTIGGTPRVSAFTPILTSEVYDSAVNGASAYFDDSAYLTAADSADFAPGTGAYTAECWVYPTRTDNEDGIFGSMDASAYGFGIFHDATRVYFWERQDGYNSADPKIEVTIAATDFAFYQWNHIVITRQTGTGGTLRAYIGGSQVGTATANLRDLTNTDSMKIGHCGGAGYDHQGYISDFRYQKGTCQYPDGTSFTPPTAPLTAITNTKLLLNMADGQALDSAAQNNMTLYGNADTSTTQQKFGTASLFLAGGGTSSTDFAQMRDANDITGPFTIECWARSAATTNSYMWCQGQYTMEFGLSGDNLFLYTGTGGSAGNFFTSGEFTVNTWHHVAVVRDTSNVIKCYLNGTASGTTFTNSATFVATSSIFIIGGEWRTGEGIHHGWDGYIDDFRISKFARYTSNFTPSTEAFPDKGQ